jgi:N-acetylglucosaminylphosphatidylinositol deacetylase
MLGISPQNITLFNCTLLPDNPTVEWKPELLSDIIQSHVEMLDIDLLITFDREGISQHKNHQAIYFATASLYLAGSLPAKCKVLVLSTVNIVRKYLSVFDVIFSLVLSTNW